MSQKRKTTALPSRTAREGRRYKSRSEREAQVNRIVLIVTGVIALIVIAVLGTAIVLDNVIAPNKVVASAAGQNVSVQAFQKQVTYQRWRYGTQIATIQNQVPQQYLSEIFGAQQNSPYYTYTQMYSDMSDPVLMGKAVLDQMTDQLLIDKYARDNNITVSQSDIDKQVDDFFSYAPTPMTSTPTPSSTFTPVPLVSPTATNTATITPTLAMTNTPTPSPIPTGQPTATQGPTEQYKSFLDNKQNYYSQAAKATGLTQDDVLQLFTEQAIMQKVKDTVTANVAPKPTADQLKVRHILVATPDQANSVLKALQEGESFASLARAISIDTGSSANGGDLGWHIQYICLPEFDTAIWNKDTKIGQILGPIKTTAGYHVIQVEARAVRSVSDSDKTTAINNQFNNFMTDLRAKGNVQDFDYVSVTPSTPALSDFGIQAGLNQPSGASGIPGLPGQ